jgi:predicted Rossmann-fold nucleotide-binding protein
MKYGVVGSRRRLDKDSVESFIASLSLNDVVVSGGCRGVDSWAEEAAKVRGIEVIIFKPAFENCKNRLDIISAYYHRNKKIAEHCDVLVAFVAPDRKGGTENTIKHAKGLKKKIVIK